MGFYRHQLFSLEGDNQKFDVIDLREPELIQVSDRLEDGSLLCVPPEATSSADSCFF